MPQRPDDESVPPEAILWRGILPSWIQSLPDGSTRPMSLAFIDGSESREVSFFIGQETTHARVMEGKPFVTLAQVSANFLRQLGYTIARDPDGADGDAAHVVACPAERKTRKDVARDAKKIAAAAVWVPS